jgi:hypothetical protein
MILKQQATMGEVKKLAEEVADGLRAKLPETCFDEAMTKGAEMDLKVVLQELLDDNSVE